MSSNPLLDDPDLDAPFFKRLAHNDTARARGHQGGMVLPKDLRKYLPELDETVTSTESPTVDRTLWAELFDGETHVADVPLRYQMQTWGGTRAAESRITDGLAPLRRLAAEGDLLVFQRHLDSLNRYRVTLLRQNSPHFAALAQHMAGRRWGVLLPALQPVSQGEIAIARDEIDALAGQPFSATRDDVPRRISRLSRVARDAVFRSRVRTEYRSICAVSAIGLTSPGGGLEVEAAHVVPVTRGGADDVRNGLALTRTLHWAFDKGLFGISPQRRVVVPPEVKAVQGNAFVAQFDGQRIAEAHTESRRVHPAAFAWHMEHIVGRQP